MKDFEELMREALQDIREAEPPREMEKRLMARVAAARSGLRWWSWMGAVAAAVVVGVVLHVVKPRPTEPRATPIQTIAQSLNIEDAGHTALEVQGAAPRLERTSRRGHKGVGLSSRLRGRPPLRIAPIEIEPLKVDELEVASLMPKNKFERGYTQ